MYTSDGYMLSFLFAIISIWIAIKSYKKRYLFISGILLSCAVGGYQASLGVGMTLSLIYLFVDMIINQKLNQKLIAKLLIVGFGGMIFYFFMMKISLKILNVQLTDYQGINQVENGIHGISVEEIILRIKCLYMDFILMFKEKLFYNFLFAAIFLIMLLLVIVNILLFSSKKLKYVLMCGLFLLIVPVTLCPIWLITSDVGYHILMKYSWAFFIILPMIIVEKINNMRLLHVVILGLAICSFGFILSNNVFYEHMSQKKDRTMLITNRIVTELEDRDLINSEKKIGFFYTDEYENAYSSKTDLIYNYCGEEFIEISYYNLEKYLKDYFMIDCEVMDKEEYTFIGESQWFKDLDLQNELYTIVEKEKYIIVKIKS